MLGVRADAPGRPARVPPRVCPAAAAVPLPTAPGPAAEPLGRGHHRLAQSAARSVRPDACRELGRHGIVLVADGGVGRTRGNVVPGICCGGGAQRDQYAYCVRNTRRWRAGDYDESDRQQGTDEDAGSAARVDCRKPSADGLAGHDGSRYRRRGRASMDEALGVPRCRSRRATTVHDDCSRFPGYGHNARTRVRAGARSGARCRARFRCSDGLLGLRVSAAVVPNRRSAAAGRSAAGRSAASRASAGRSAAGRASASRCAAASGSAAAGCPA
ncbi:hypothetical protein FB390_4169 [Nocardia bhagyanarayanae]|uniref:Uncharacterized protein n=1 Tax=Nocardia bhagyanarayanae TaxID=1215925 RepID=A0A543FF54_9NOCA|nr:hypothetical protein FB390_4169 [Nocardia bhagyanarayanae]